VTTAKNGENALVVQIKGMHCASCAARVQKAAGADGTQAAIDLNAGRGRFVWRGDVSRAEEIVGRIEGLGYDVAPLAPERDGQESETAFLQRCMIVAGVASALVMALGMMVSPPVWLMAALTVGALFYAGRPFLVSAARALRGGHANMDVPISLALALTTGMSLFEIAHQGTYAYFDSVVMLLFILLVGRYLDARTRGRARAAAADLLALFTGHARIIEGDQQREIPVRELRPDMVLVVAAGEKIAADGVVTQGESEVDPSLITGETLPESVCVGASVFGGMINLTTPLHVRITAAAADGLVAEVVRLMEKAQQAHARFVRLADRVAMLYTPAVFFLAVITFLGWAFMAGAPWQKALLVTSTVLIITCPCAMGLAVPAVQVIASARLFRKGMLLKTGDALEKLAKVDTIVFDKTGTVTEGHPQLQNRGDFTAADLKLAASLAVASRHPLARAVVSAHGEGPVFSLGVTEHPGRGLEALWDGKKVLLGRRDWCGDESAAADDRPELWLSLEGFAPVRMVFADALKVDAIETMAELSRRGFRLFLYSGDRASVVQATAQALGLSQYQGQMSPTDKHAAIQVLRDQGQHVLMVGDGLNDAAALAAADVSLSPATALDMAQNAADIVFQGRKLAPVIEALTAARKAEALVRQNIGLSLGYNLVAVPLAMVGLASPLVAAAAMSLSSLTVVLNAQRMRG
jgi:Cu2+-exporting ATPase